MKSFIPFEKIGLCFSGGGYRASFFSLGALKYLNHCQYKNTSLLKSVKAISSVSGGTLTAVAYAKAINLEGFDFTDFYEQFISTFEGNDNLIKKATEKLADDRVWKVRSDKRRTLINSFALSYAELDIFKRNFKELIDGSVSFCFNATEFSEGLAFRFQTSGTFGNAKLKISKDLAHPIQLGDIVAASSCFPLGFEPILFPNDFYKDHNSEVFKEITEKEEFEEGAGLMDGGIADNQGIGSMVRFHERKSDGPLDLIMVNDVASYKVDDWKASQIKTSDPFNLQGKVNQVLSVLKLRWIALIVAILSLFWCMLDLPRVKVATFLLGVSSVLSILCFGLTYLVNWISKKINNALAGKPSAIVDAVKSFKKLRLGLLNHMIAERLSSGLTMINEIFLKQIRKLNNDLFYKSEALNNRKITSTVYQLNGIEKLRTITHKENSIYKKIPVPSKKLNEVARIASETATALWWTKNDLKKDRMKALIACGQFTNCYNLMKYLIELEKAGYTSEELDTLYSQLLGDWKKFNEDPKYMV